MMDNKKIVVSAPSLFNDYRPEEYRPRKKDSYVYVFLMENNTIKIGKSIHVERRKKTIEHMSGMNIIQYWTSKAHTSRGASDLEAIAHQKFNEFRLVGEFFNMPFKKAVSFIKSKEDYTDTVDEMFIKKWHRRWVKREAEKKAYRDKISEECFSEIRKLLDGQVESNEDVACLLVEIDEIKKFIIEEHNWESQNALMYAVDLVGDYHNINLSKLKDLGKSKEELEKEFEAEKKQQLWALLETANETKMDIVRKMCIKKALKIISSNDGYLFFPDERKDERIFAFADGMASDIESEYGIEQIEAERCAYEIANGYYGMITYYG